MKRDFKMEEGEGLQDKLIITRCCNCDLYRIDDLWQSVSPDTEKLIEERYLLSHGYCPKHYKEALEELDEEKTPI